MRQIIVKYTGNCKKCDALLEVGQPAMYEKSMGIFCIGCEPVDTEEIREYRQIKADIKADKYDTWASKREAQATAKLNSYPEIRHDWAFITQPGRIPLRDRMNKSDERAFESLNKAKEMRQRACGLRHVQVAGDAERKRQAKRDQVLTWLKVGMLVDTIIFGQGTVKKINKKTATITNTGMSGTATFNVELSFLEPVNKINQEVSK